MGKRLATKRATSVSDTIAFIKALRARGFAADLKGSKNEKEEFGLESISTLGCFVLKVPTGYAVSIAF